MNSIYKNKMLAKKLLNTKKSNNSYSSSENKKFTECESTASTKLPSTYNEN